MLVDLCVWQGFLMKQWLGYLVRHNFAVDPVRLEKHDGQKQNAVELQALIMKFVSLGARGSDSRPAASPYQVIPCVTMILARADVWPRCLVCVSAVGSGVLAPCAIYHCYGGLQLVLVGAHRGEGVAR
jgi:hypothetical protein